MTTFVRIVRRGADCVTQWQRIGLFACGLLTTACAESSGPLSVVTLRTEIAPASVSQGDTVVMRAILTNPSTRQLDLASPCGPPVLFEVRSSSGDLIYPIPLNTAFTCERNDGHDLAPGEVDTVYARWRVTAAAGQYTVRSGFRSEANLRRLTSPIALTIR
jgi:hypothetical protein